MSEPLTPQRNLERVLGLWPSAGLTADWKNLFLSRFRNANQDWLRTAIENVKFAKGSHVPELKWFADEFEEVRRHASAVARDEPQTLEQRAERREQERERDRLEVEAERVKIRHAMANLHGSAIDRIRDTMRNTRFLASLVGSMDGEVSAWPDLALGMAHAVARRDGILDGQPATFAGVTHFAGDDR